MSIAEGPVMNIAKGPILSEVEGSRRLGRAPRSKRHKVQHCYHYCGASAS